MKVLVTGGNGFLGKNVVKNLLAQGYEVEIGQSHEYDLRNEESCQNLIKSVKPETVIHLAASVGGIGANMINPAKFFYDNISMGINVIHQSYLQKVNKVILVGTVCSYPKFCKVPFKEEDLWNGYPEETNASYGIAKKSLMVMLEAYNQQYGLKGTSLLPCNLYGPGDNFNPNTSHVIPALIKKFIDAKHNNDKKVVCWGSGNATREFLYVEDAAEAVVKSVGVDTNLSAINLGGGREVTIRELVQQIGLLVGFQGEIEWDTTKPDGQPRRFLDSSRAEKVLGWKASTDFNKGLLQTIEWYKNVVHQTDGS